MKKLVLIPIIVCAFACGSSSEPTSEEKQKAAKESDSAVDAANDFLSNDTAKADTNKKAAPIGQPAKYK